jgi:hypothetical protein
MLLGYWSVPLVDWFLRSVTSCPYLPLSARFKKAIACALVLAPSVAASISVRVAALSVMPFLSKDLDQCIVFAKRPAVMFNHFDHIHKTGHVVCVCFVGTLLVFVVGTFSFVEGQVNVFLTLKLVRNWF